MLKTLTFICNQSFTITEREKKEMEVIYFKHGTDGSLSEGDMETLILNKKQNKTKNQHSFEY